MEKILMIEPNYKNKYPPIGLMKIATYFRHKGDFVEFHKGLLSKEKTQMYDKVLITTLFTFDFDTCLNTIKYYIAIKGTKNVYVGGIAATIMPQNFYDKIPNIQLIRGQLVSSNFLGYTDEVNIDILELDYDILWDIEYDYPAADSYFIYTTRGCPRKCPFCAVKTLEPNFYDCENIIDQISRVNEEYGIKKHLLIMDNNILYSKKLASTIHAIQKIGFGCNNNKIKKNNIIKFYIKSLKSRIDDGRNFELLLKRILVTLGKVKKSRMKQDDISKLSTILNNIAIDSNSAKKASTIISNEGFLIDFFDRYCFHKITRYVDFNQGLDARLFTDAKAKLLSSISLKPCRIAFDDLSNQDKYLNAMNLAVKHGIRYFSNYLLYNYQERPEELWLRLYLNINFCVKHNKDNVSLFSFPMKYAAIDYTDRSFIGKYWNRKYLRAINVILNVTKGVVAKEEDFFFRAFGKSEKEFIEILTMPDEFIRYRDFFDDNGLIMAWKVIFRQLDNKERDLLLKILSDMIENPDILTKKYSSRIDKLLWFYSLNKDKVENNRLYYRRFLKKMK